jgi:hypothetical protein
VRRFATGGWERSRRTDVLVDINEIDIWESEKLVGLLMDNVSVLRGISQSMDECYGENGERERVTVWSSRR